jgi:hypothetical protein
MEQDEINKHDADAGNDGYSNELLQKEHRIDPGNEHHHQGEKGGADKKNEGKDSGGNTWVNKHDADAGGDGTGTMGPAPPTDDKTTKKP